MSKSVQGTKVLLVAEGSGGHLIPALQVATALAQRGVRVRLWYVSRATILPLADALTRTSSRRGVEIEAIRIPSGSRALSRLRRCGELWRRTHSCFETFAPDVVVGFGGWISAPVILAARWRRATDRYQRKNNGSRIGCVLHEQNAVMGRANRVLAGWVDQVALSFEETQDISPVPHVVTTGLPIREEIGRPSRQEAAKRLGLAAERPTILVLGGSQGAQAINRLMTNMAASLSDEERQRWQILHLSGGSDGAAVNRAYAAAAVTASVRPFLVEMEDGYALADVVVSRAGASTIAELASCGKPAVFIPYPYAGGHQKENARLVETVGGGIVIEESAAGVERVLTVLRRLLGDERLRVGMGERMRVLHRSDAARRLSRVILKLAGHAETQLDDETIMQFSSPMRGAGDQSAYQNNSAVLLLKARGSGFDEPDKALPRALNLQPRTLINNQLPFTSCQVVTGNR